MTDPDIQDLKEREQSKNTDDDGGESGESATPDPSSGGGGGSFPIPRKYVALGVVIAVALIAWKLKSADGSSSSSADDDDELSGDVEAAEDDESGITLDVPAGAGQDKKDAAVLQYLTETGRMEG